MLNADSSPRFDWCPRCRTGGLEKLKTHSHCVNCNWHTDEAGSESGSYYYPLNRHLKKQIEEIMNAIVAPAGLARA